MNIKIFNGIKFINKVWYRLILVVYALIVPVISLAEQNPFQPIAGTNPSDPSQGKIVNPIPSIKSIPGLIETILEGVLRIGIPIIALAIIYCGFLFVKAQGKPEEITKAKDALLWTLVGSAILLGAWAIAKMISATVFAL